MEINAGKGGGEVEPLSHAVELARFDLGVDAPSEASHRVALTATRAGRAEALLRWLRLDFGDGIRFENRPPQHSCWDPQLQFLPRARYVRPGDQVHIEVAHNRDRLFLWPVADGDDGGADT